ncbi:hypothetical protein SISNIDRAFT_447543 [Sistotremastrum niveocremeum HHB9708]|uniref:BHLH domain-containing protein n=1 Tax=Sistotremastrum niveocremeum HHB9708 TaxID=1314777 RepID=A0A165ABP4_9AGAM|nr:hypothetical protein SISNIDRAFT_447543 [Sistotremastrum niveocremeum HHB9708]
MASSQGGRASGSSHSTNNSNAFVPYRTQPNTQLSPEFSGPSFPTFETQSHMQPLEQYLHMAQDIADPCLAFGWHPFHFHSYAARLSSSAPHAALPSLHERSRMLSDLKAKGTPAGPPLDDSAVSNTTNRGHMADFDAVSADKRSRNKLNQAFEALRGLLRGYQLPTSRADFLGEVFKIIQGLQEDKEHLRNQVMALGHIPVV